MLYEMTEFVFWHASTSILGRIEDQGWFKVQAVPVFRFD
jgi:hypothetical protein